MVQFSVDQGGQRSQFVPIVGILLFGHRMSGVELARFGDAVCRSLPAGVSRIVGVGIALLGGQAGHTVDRAAGSGQEVDFRGAAGAGQLAGGFGPVGSRSWKGGVSRRARLAVSAR